MGAMLEPLTNVRFLGFLLFCAAFITLSAAKDDDDEPETPKCEGRMIPGIKKMVRGVDITELDFFPTDKLQRAGFRKPVIALTCLKGGKWIHPSTDLDTEYAKPDQVAGINTNPSGDMKARAEITSETEEFKVSQLAKVGLEISPLGSGSGLFGFFSSSSSLKMVEENLYQKNRSVAETSSTVSAIHIDFKVAPLLSLNDDFLYDVIQLKGTYEKNPKLYDEFIATYGTHYFGTGLFGGYLYQKTLLTEVYNMATTENEIKANLKASFYGVTGSAGTENTRKTTTDSFRANSETSFAFFGGTAITIDPTEPLGKFLETWVPTVNRDPWLFGGQLKPIEQLIRSPIIRLEVKKAVDLKRARAYLAEVKRLVRLGLVKLSDTDEIKLRYREEDLKEANPGYIENAVEFFDSLQQTIQDKRDRSLMDELLHHLSNDSPGLKCKKHALFCTLNAHGGSDDYRKFKLIVDKEVEEQEKLAREIAYWKHDPTGHEAVRELKKATAEMVYTHQSNALNICGGERRSTCNSCELLRDECADSENRSLINWI